MPWKKTQVDYLGVKAFKGIFSAVLNQPDHNNKNNTIKYWYIARTWFRKVINIITMKSVYFVDLFRILLFVVSFAASSNAKGYGNSKLTQFIFLKNRYTQMKNISL